VSGSATWRLVSPAAVGAVAVIELVSDPGAVGPELRRLGLGEVAAGACALRDILGVDRGLIARVGDGVAWLMPHGGLAVVRAICRELERRGVPERRGIDPRRSYPEAGDVFEARMLAALARAPSPIAVELLLDQPRRWRLPGATNDPARDRLLDRLIEPPLVVAVGPSNIGKSTLLNALAGRGVSIVADEPGTTRDHVGVTLDLGGLWVRFIDTPGVRHGLDPRMDAPEIEAAAAARALLAGAALVLSCGDPARAPLAVETKEAVLTVCLRADLGPASWACDRRVSVVRREGIDELVAAARETLVPAWAREHPGPWAFCDGAG
jgi:tRNA modification GTPase